MLWNISNCRGFGVLGFWGFGGLPLLFTVDALDSVATLLGGLPLEALDTGYWSELLSSYIIDSVATAPLVAFPLPLPLPRPLPLVDGTFSVITS